MPIPERQKKYNSQNIKRVPLDMQKKDYDIIKEEAVKQGESVNRYIKTAIWQRMERSGVDTSKLKSKISEDSQLL